jgi:hypothetical protein
MVKRGRKFESQDLGPAIAVVVLGGVVLGSWTFLINPSNKQRTYGMAGYLLFIGAVLFSTCPPIPQSQAYHNFADQRNLCCIPNTFDVLSNIPFLLVAIIGLGQLYLSNITSGDSSDNGLFQIMQVLGLRQPVFLQPESEQYVWATYFVGVGLVFLGSTYYHLQPNNTSLVWDRLPMTVSFMSLFAVILSETLHIHITPLILLMLVIIGVGSVLYWRAYDDLRPYCIIQFGTLISIPICFGLSSGDGIYQGTGGHYITALAFYLAAKITETYDHEIFQLTGRRVSGHTLKHLLSGLATAWATVILSSRELLESETSSPNSIMAASQGTTYYGNSEF